MLQAHQRLVLEFAYATTVVCASVHCAYMLTRVVPGDMAWLGAATAVWSVLLVFARRLTLYATAKSQKPSDGDPAVTREEDRYQGIGGLTLLGFALVCFGALQGGVPMLSFAIFYSLGVGVLGFKLYQKRVLAEAYEESVTE